MNPTTADPVVATARPASIGIVVADGHPALRAGLSGLLRGEPGLRPLAALASADGLCPMVQRLRPDVLVLDYGLGRGGGLSACFRVKQLPDPPRVLLYCASVEPVFAIPARLAQADALVPKTAPVPHLLDAIRAVAGGASLLPAPGPDAMEAVASRLDAVDLPVAGMLLAATPTADIARALGVVPGEVRARALRIIGRLQAG